MAKLMTCSYNGFENIKPFLNEVTKEKCSVVKYITCNEPIEEGLSMGISYVFTAYVADLNILFELRLSCNSKAQMNKAVLIKKFLELNGLFINKGRWTVEDVESVRELYESI
jgi:hypothetical protein